MKKKIYYLLLILLLSLKGISQNSMIIEYSVSMNTMERKGILFYSTKENCFYTEKYKSNLNTDNKTSIEEQNSSNIKVYSKIDINKEYIQEYLKNEIINNYDFVGNKKVQYQDTCSLLKWIIKNETKFIDKYKCTKAVCNFRGRNYIAWFSTEIPVTVGPWKFHGLPGLIFQISDESGLFVWNLEKIKSVPTLPKLVVEKNIEKVSFRNLVIKQTEDNQREQQEKMDLIMSKLSLKLGNIKTKQAVFQRGRELIYDWERK
jgi:GLPGLI family protein